MKQVKVIVLLVIIILAITFLLKKSRAPVYTHTATLVDVVANKIFLKDVPRDASYSFPTSSPYSTGNNAYLVYKCLHDGTIFAFDMSITATDQMETTGLPPSESEEELEKDMPKCPVCSSLDVTIPELPDGQTSMDITGPIKIVKPE